MTQQEMTDRLRAYAELMNSITTNDSLGKYLMPGCTELAKTIAEAAKKLLETYCK